VSTFVPSAREAARRLAARLVHDVGKYVARTARNVAPGSWTPELRAMMCRDLFDEPRGRASAVFEALATAIEEHLGSRIEIARARGLLADIDHSEALVRAGDVAALDRAAKLALGVDDVLRTLAKNLQENLP
jgi:hypothetical protein